MNHEPKEWVMPLVLGRSDHEKIYVGDDVVIQLVMVGNKVRLSIQCPRDVPVLRGELLKEWEAAMIEAAAREPKRRK